MSGYSLKARLGWLIGVVLVSTLLTNLAIQLVHAGPRVRAEAGSNLRLVREFVLTTIANLPESEDPAPALRRLYASLGHLRHADVQIVSANDPVPRDWLDKIRHADRGVPEWFVKLVGASPRVLSVPVIVGGHAHSSILVISNPFDELEEVWSDMVWLASISLAVTIVFLTLVLLFLRYSLAPFDMLQEGLSQLETGKSGVRLAPGGATEFKSISNALNSLASTLDRVRLENQQLVSELIEIQDNERKDIARDLHDEAGPCLFSIRAAASSLQELVSQPAPDPERLREHGAILDRASETLQVLIRGLLGRLRPVGLAELGLGAALDSLIGAWRLGHPEVDLRLVAPHDLSSLDKPTAFAAYRVVQEAVTNIFRHADARWAQVVVQFGEARGDAVDAEPELRLVIEDDGEGIPKDHRSGMGLLGMRERVQALGGSMSVERRIEGGTRVSVSFPVRDDDEAMN